MHDNSMASQGEAWIVSRLRECDAFDADLVEQWEGSSAQSGQKLVAELIGKATSSRPFVAVMFAGDVPVPLPEGRQAYNAKYLIYVVVTNDRPGVARMGQIAELPTTPPTPDYIGTNGLRDVIRLALHDKTPNIGAAGYHTDQTVFRGVDLVYEGKGGFIMVATVEVEEGPTGQ